MPKACGTLILDGLSVVLARRFLGHHPLVLFDAQSGGLPDGWVFRLMCFWGVDSFRSSLSIVSSQCFIQTTGL